MLSPLFEEQSFLFDTEFADGWDMTAFHREAAALSDMAEFWADVEAETASMAMVPPAGSEPEDWVIRSDDEHKDKLVHHDCMWTGFCADSGHPSSAFVAAEVPMQNGRSLLRRTLSPQRPDTPPSLDEEDPPQFTHTVDIAGEALRLLHDSAAVAADHSYTSKPPAKHNFESLGVQTPSDSEEEIDVVSLGEKSPPSTPSSESASSRSASPRGELLRHRALPSRHVQPAPRKRLVPPGPGRKRARGPGRRPRRPAPDTDSDPEAPELERRSLHNDMERMRRIGLKNLFEQLKEEVPSIRDKERAPKVVILREAAAHCRRLQLEAEQRDQLKRDQLKLLARLRRLRAAR